MGWEWTVSGLGLGIGLLVGLTGMGAGSVLTPLLILALGVDPLVAVGSSLAHAALMKAVGTWRHAELGTVDWDKVRWLAMGSLPAILAVGIFLGLVQHDSLAKANALVGRVLGAAMVLVALLLLWRVLGRRPGTRGGAGWLEGPWGPSLLALAGTWVGTLVGLSSVGSGSFLIPILALGTGLPARRLVGTDIAHALLLMGAGTLVHGSLGNVSWPLVAGLLLGSVPGIWLGSLASVRLPDPMLRHGMAAVLMFTGFKLVWRFA